MTITVPIHNIKLIELEDIITTSIECDLLNDIQSYGLIDKNTINIRSRTVQRLMYHHIVLGLCEYILSVKGKEKIIIAYSTTTLISTSQLCEYVSESDLQSFFSNLILKIKKVLPIKFIDIKDTSFPDIASAMQENTGLGIETINRSKIILGKFDISRYSFAKAKNFAKKYGLEYLSNNYFQQIKSKQLILG